MLVVCTDQPLGCDHITDLWHYHDCVKAWSFLGRLASLAWTIPRTRGGVCLNEIGVEFRVLLLYPAMAFGATGEACLGRLTS